MFQFGHGADTTIGAPDEPRQYSSINLAINTA